MSKLYIGLMSGTSIDGIDAVLVDFASSPPVLINHHYQKYPSTLRNDIINLCRPSNDEINRLGEMDVALGHEFADAVQTLLQKNQTSTDDIIAIGSHGQTIRHHPQRKFTLQIGDPNVIAAKTGITTVADFRRRDIALGGQGAPLVPAFHQAIFSSPLIDRAIVNIGGIANITLLLKNDNVLGFDTGPGNTLLDQWAEQYLQSQFDDQGKWAAQGTVHAALLADLLNDSFFALLPPKSTGREHFNLSWLKNKLSQSIAPIDVQATLVELTAQSIVTAIKNYTAQCEIFICGGGAYNLFLLGRIRELAKPCPVETTTALGIHPCLVEAMAFAWLAQQTLGKKTGNLTEVTGATKRAVLGGVYFNQP